MSKTAPAPKLRFPEFHSVGNWNETTIGDIGSFYYGKSAPKWSLADDAPTPCVRYGELYTRFGAKITETYSKTNVDPKNLRFSKGGEILVPRVGERPEEFGKCCSYLPFANTAIGEMISVFETTQNPLFYTYYFRNLYLDFAKVVEGQNVKNLYYAVLEPLKICRPTPPEQLKIANCLTSVDDLITAYAQKLEALKIHKKGLMQQLFPGEGETIPRLRFSEFSGAEAWHKKVMGDVGTFSKGKGVSKADIHSDGSQLCIRYGQLYTDYGEVIDKVKSATNLLPEGLVLSHAGDVIIPASGETQIDIATASCVLRSGVALGGDLNIFRSNINGTFLAYYLSGARKRAIAEMAQGISVVHLYPSQLTTLNIAVPSPAEQQKIADCLSSVDDLITAQTQKIVALKDHKMGLMQQLFPTSDEVSG